MSRTLVTSLLAAAVFFGASASAAPAAGEAEEKTEAAGKETPKGHTVTREVDQAVVEKLARDIIDGLDRGKRQEIDQGDWRDRLDDWIDESTWYMAEKWKGYKGQLPADRGRKIALWPFWKEKDLPVDANFARILGHTLRSMLVNGAGPNYQVVTRDELLRLENEIDEFNHLKVSAEKINQLIRAAGADILVVTDLIPNTSTSVMVSASAQEVLTGVTLAAAPPRLLPYDADVAASLGLDQSLRHAAAYFLDRLPDLRIVRPQGVRYQDTRVQTGFGSWFGNRFVTEIKRSASRRRGRSILVADAVITTSRGLNFIEKPADGMMGAIVKSCVWADHAAARSWRSPSTNLTPRMISARWFDPSSFLHFL